MMKKIFRFFKYFSQGIFYSSWIIVLSSLFWFLWRTGTKPTRIAYPCQQVARTNISLFGLPAIAPFWLRLRKCRKFRLKVLFLSILTLSFLIGAYGFTKSRTRLVEKFWWMRGLLEKETQVLAQTASSRVVWVHDSNATDWDFGSDYYGNFVDQAVVDNMMDQGLMALTSMSNVADAWRALIPDYHLGQKIAVKVNFNNSYGCDACETACSDSQLKSDGLIQSVNALVKGLKQMGVAEENIWVYDASSGRRMPDRFTNGCLYPDVKFFDYGEGSLCSGHQAATYTSTDPTAQIDFLPPGGIVSPPEDGNTKLSDVLIDADYLINMPLMKKHGAAGVTLSFKNHFGSIKQCGVLHNWVYPGSVYYSAIYNPMVDIYNNPNIRDKTILTVGDGFYGDRKSNYSKPDRWVTFGNDAPNSLFFSQDPVAIDSVMYDVLRAEGYGGLWEQADDYLPLAEVAGLGVFEHGDPWGSGYTRIDLVKCDQQGKMDPLCLGGGPSPSPSPSALPTPPPPVSTPTQTPVPILGDVDDDGDVDFQDLLATFLQWLTPGTSPRFAEDINLDGKVNIPDAAVVIKNWGLK